ncbi:MAG TPA: type I restriction-modification system subunit M N-terminal domain-containing protein [Thermodesulfobacteriota bacterium]|nr:type I restriction-modification system subunit M N-terminal domain-containing protein [Thermodesulfobacteriota bacterium]
MAILIPTLGRLKRNRNARGIFTNEIENRLWESADQLRANSKLRSPEYSVPVLRLIFLRFADYKSTITKDEIERMQVAAEALLKLIPR